MTLRRFPISVFVCLVLLAGCVERAERLTVRPDGSVLLELEYSSDSPEDIYQGDAVPAAGGAWVVEERQREDAEGKVTYTLYAMRVVAPDSPLPASYAEGDRAHSTLRFPTELVIEPRDDGTYFHFRRTYEPRRWAYVELKRREIVDEPLKGIVNKPAGELSPAERQQMLRAFAQFEVEKAIVFGREALFAAIPETPQDLWLAVEAEMRRLPDEVDYADLIRIIDEPNERTRDRALRAEVERFERAIKERLEQSAKRQMGFTRGKLNRFLAEFDAKRAEYLVTEDVSDDVFRIEVTMPGEIVASNARSAGSTTARWEFTGQHLRDAGVELMVSSVVR